ncbi:MAG: 50S ribosomal protein L10 [candidate division WS1 bacterium]|jgi:large subunit ribosomal protein L10|nr:50S ribosomal protein L10 [candidate division WS1 bacterium]
MKIPTKEKKQMVEEMREHLEDAGSVYLTAFQGLSVSAATELRGQLLEAGGHMQVVKNRLLKVAVEGTDYESLAEMLAGPNAITYCGDDPVEPLKVLATFAESHDQPPVKAGVVDGEILSAEQIDKLSKVPPLDELRATVVGGIASPVTGFVYTLSGLVSDLVFTLQAVADKRGEAAA